jgi:hypothetical protein
MALIVLPEQEDSLNDRKTGGRPLKLRQPYRRCVLQNQRRSARAFPVRFRCNKPVRPEHNIGLAKSK